MKKRVFLTIITILFPCICFSQWFESSWNGGTLTVRGGINGSSSSYSLSRDDVWSGPSSSRSSSGNNRGNSSSSSSENTYSGPEFIGSWGGSDTYSNALYERLIDKQESEKLKKDMANDEAWSCLAKMKKLLIDDCIDYRQLEKAIGDYTKLSGYQKRLLGGEGKNAYDKLSYQLEKGKPYYDKYSLMALNITSDTYTPEVMETMNLPYEKLNRYLKLFLSKEEFDRAKTRFEEYKKSRSLKELHSKIKNHKPQEKSKTTGKTGAHTVLQKIKNNAKNKGQVSNHNIKIDNLTPNGIAISEEWKEVSVEVIGKTMDKFFEPLKEHTYNLGSGYTGLTKRLVNFSETYSSTVFDLWDAFKKASQALVRGENPEPYLINGQHKAIDNTYRGAINSF